jgi:hypothetical protein
VTTSAAVAAVAGGQLGYFIGAVRTFTPVIAGASGMRYRVFLTYDVIGATAWGAGLAVVGYYLGGVSFISAHLDWMVVSIAALSIVPVRPPPCEPWSPVGGQSAPRIVKRRNSIAVPGSTLRAPRRFASWACSCHCWSGAVDSWSPCCGWT